MTFFGRVNFFVPEFNVQIFQIIYKSYQIAIANINNLFKFNLCHRLMNTWKWILMVVLVYYP